MKKILLFLLALSLLVVAVGCGGNKKPTGTTEPTSQTIQEGDPNKEYLENLPERDYGMDDFRILITTAYDSYYHLDEEDGADSVEWACFTRNSVVEDKYKISLNYTALDGNGTGATQFAATIRNNAASDTPFDLVMGQGYYCLPLAAEGYLADMAGSEYLHFDKDWYYSNINQNCVINDKMYAACGDFVVSTIASTCGLWFNTQMKTALGIEENLYDLVDDGEWTLDVFEGMVKDVYQDVNYNFYADEGDLFGLSGPPQLAKFFFTSTENPVIRVGIDGIPSCEEYYNDRLINVFDNLLKFIKTDDVTSYNANAQSINLYVNGQALFIGMTLGSLLFEEVRNCNWVGIVPFPKYDESQKDYISPTMRTELFYIPSVANFERSCIVTEYLNYTTYTQFLPQFWDSALQLKAVDRPEDARMLSLIRETSEIGFDEIWCGFFNSASNIVPNLVMNNNNMLASQWRSAKDSLEESLEILYESFE